MSSSGRWMVTSTMQTVARNKKLLDIIANRYKRLDHIAKAMKCTEKTVITYLKLARKDGYVIDCKRNKGQRPSYKLMKGVS